MTMTLNLTLTLTLTLALALALSRTAVALDRKSFCGRPGCNAAWSLQASNGFGTCGEQIKWTQGNIEGASSMADACEYVAAQASTPECAPCGAAAAEAEAVKRLSADEAEEEEEKDEDEEEEQGEKAQAEQQAAQVEADQDYLHSGDDADDLEGEVSLTLPLSLAQPYP